MQNTLNSSNNFGIQQSRLTLHAMQNGVPEKRRKLLPLLPKALDLMNHYENGGGASQYSYYKQHNLNFHPSYQMPSPHQLHHVHQMNQIQPHPSAPPPSPASPPSPSQQITHHPTRVGNASSNNPVPLPAHIPHLQLPPAHITQHRMPSDGIQDLQTHHHSRKLDARYKLEATKHVEPSHFYPYPYYPYMWPLYDNSPYAPPSAINNPFNYYPAYYQLPPTTIATPAAYEVPSFNSTTNGTNNHAINGISNLNGVNGGLQSYYRPF